MTSEYCLLDDALDETDSALSAHDLAPDFYQDPALTMASLLRMMSRFPSNCSPALAQSIAAHLQLLAADGRQHPEIRLCAAELMQDWALMTTLSAMPAPAAITESALH